jgi:hypothetical protein
VEGVTEIYFDTVCNAMCCLGQSMFRYNSISTTAGVEPHDAWR